MDALLNAEVLAAAPSPELAELVELASQPETWLGQLLGAYSELFLPPRPTKAAKIDPSTPLIVAVSIDEDAPCFRETLEEWRQSLKQLVLRFARA